MSGKENGVYIQKRTLIITICVALALNATSLFMGITIGRQQDKQQLPNDYNIPVSRQPQGEVASESDTLDQDLAYFEESKEREQPVPVDYLEDSTFQEEEAVADQQEVPPPTETAIAATETVDQPVVEAPKPPPGIPTSADLQPGFWLQVLAINDLTKAKSFESRLKAQNYQGALISEGPLFKVLIGPYAERTEATEARPKVNQTFSVEAWIRKL